MSIRVNYCKKSVLSNNVLLKSNDAIIAYCDTEEEANRFIEDYNLFANKYIRQNVYE